MFNEAAETSRKYRDRERRYEDGIKSLKGDLETAAFDISDLKEKIKNMRKMHEQELEEAKRDHEAEQKRILGEARKKITESESTRDRLAEDYRVSLEAGLAERDKQHSIQIRKYQAEQERLKEEHKRLKGNLIADRHDSLAWSEEKIRDTMQRLKNMVDGLTSPHELKDTLPTDLRRRIDPAQILADSDQRYHLVLKNATWRILIEGFFNSPLGFGAFGPSIDILQHIFRPWRDIVQGAGGAGEQIFTCFSCLYLPLQFLSVTSFGGFHNADLILINYL